MSNRDYYRTPQWQDLRQAVLRRCRGRCERCRMRRATQVHHRTYERFGRERLSDLRGLCEPCHEWVHGLRLDDPAWPPRSARKRVRACR